MLKALDEGALAQAYLSGATMAGLAIKHRVSPGTISNRLRKIGVPLRERPKPICPQFRVPYVGYWNDWSNVERHLRELAALHGGIIPGRASFLSAGLDSLHTTLMKRWGGVRAVRVKLGLSGIKCCVVCGLVKDRDSGFRLQRKAGAYHYSSICKVCSSLRVESYRDTWEGRAAELVRRAKDRASKYRLEFDLDQPWIYQRLVGQGFRCEVTNIPLARGRGGSSGVGFANRYAASLDRIDSGRGYTKDNVRIVCNRINTALGDLTDEQFEEFAIGFLQTRGYRVERGP